MDNETVETKEVQTINLVLTVDEINLLLAGLGELPAKLSLGLIEKVRQQTLSQINSNNQ